MKNKRSVIAAAATVVGIGVASIVGVTAANAATADQQSASSTTGSISVDENGKVSKTGDVSDATISSPQTDAATQAKVDKLLADHPGAGVSIDKDGNVSLLSGNTITVDSEGNPVAAPAGAQVTGSISVDENGNVSRTGDVSDAVVGSPQIDAATQAKIDKLLADHPGAGVSIDKDGKVSLLSGHETTATATKK